VRVQGKSQRRWQMLHAMHLMALRDLIRKHSRRSRKRRRTSSGGGMPAARRHASLPTDFFEPS
jgi:hypothetical protein